jgi:excisionase family DNA binding protein
MSLMSRITSEDRYIGAVEAASILHVDRRTVLRWARAGTLPGRRTAGGHWRFKLAAVVALWDKESTEEVR